MKAWHVQDSEGEMQEIVFANKRSEAIYKSEAFRGWTEYINVRAKRAKYADGLENEPSKLIQAQLDNGWWFECRTCSNPLMIDDEPLIDENDRIFCDATCEEILKKKIEENKRLLKAGASE